MLRGSSVAGVRDNKVSSGQAAPADLPDLAELKSPAIPLADLADLEGTLALLRETGVLP